MSPSILILHPLLFFALLLWCVDVRASGRLAVLAPAETADNGALLMAALAHCDGVELVERDEIEKLLSEKKVTAGPVIAALLRADGLIFLEKTRGFLTTRIVDGRSGAILRVFSSPLPAANGEVWSENRTAEIAELARKLPLAAAGAVPVALLRINSATGGAEAAALEDGLNVLLASRLSYHEGIVLLERAKLQDAAAEASLTCGESELWKSSWILEGSVTASESGYLLRLRLQPPDGKGARDIVVQAADVPTAIERANAAILGALGKQNVSWDGAAESARLLAEARWAAANRMWDQAIASIEAAIVLGDNGTDLLKWRWKCYEQLAGQKEGDSGQKFTPTRRVEAMTRCLLLCREWLPSSPEKSSGRAIPLPDGRASPGPQLGPTGEATALLASTSQFLMQFSRKQGRPDTTVDVRKLQEQCRLLFDDIVQASPGLQLQPRGEGDVPAWRREGDPRFRKWMSASDAGRPQWKNLELENAHIVRLRSGRLWEEDPKPYQDHVRKCLSSDLPADPFFFPLTVSMIADMSGRAAFIPTDPEGLEWKQLAQAMAHEKNAGQQIGAAAIFCRIGLPAEALKIYEQRREDVLKGKFPLEYLLMSFSAQFTVESIIRRQGGGSLRDVIGSLVEFSVSLWKDGLAPAARVVEALAALPLSDRQSASLLAALRERPEAVREFYWALGPLVARAGENVSPPPAEPPSPRELRGSAQPKVEAIKVDLAWVAKNVDFPEKPAAIRWVLPDGNRVWLQVDFPTSEANRVRRQFVVVDLPSLQVRVVHRDVLKKGSSFAVGPLFAISGDTVYFWDGKGISRARGGQVGSLGGAELSEPFLWLIGDRLFAADREGVLAEYDLHTSASNIVASARRRPAVSPLDAEPGLRSLRKITGDRQGNITVWLPSSSYWRGAEGQWKKVTKEHMSRPSLAELAESLEDGWQEGNSLQMVKLSPHLMEALASESPDSHAKPIVQSATFRDGVLWCLQREIVQNVQQLVRLELQGGKSLCRDLDFSPEFLAYAEIAGFEGGFDNENRLIPLDAGAVIYAPGRPVLWFLPTSKISDATPP